MTRTALFNPNKSVFNFKIQYKNGKTLPIDLHDKNLWVESFQIFSPSPDHKTESIEGQHGSIYYGTTLKDRKITSTISIEAFDFVDFDLFRDEIFQMFNPLEKFYIIRDLQPGKRMEVSVDSEFDIDYETLEDGKFTIDFVIHSVFLESIGTTMDSFTFDSNLWQIGQGLIAEDTKYTHNTTSFRIYNAGDVTIDPRSMPLQIKYIGASNNLAIKNITTGDIWSYSKEMLPTDWILLDGVKSYKPGTGSIFKSTNWGLITLQPGWNEFVLDGTIGEFTIKFDFRFYYL
ncbi:phage tail family protein [Bacillus thuringiensis LM1212]|uniref:phage tail family protein n=1 Tax=Bacillus cereus group TaxID=86661 RepID=UPI0003FB810B|nr:MULTISPECIES: phage tail family protein [Bacillus cereus group]AXY05490.1 phage tail family protein [Bacillus thuringiensis LM1212]QDF23909.1 phage tail family protein [Bacillus tropicus]QUG97226.1 phage tail family protein [Bacillus tropicus]